MNRGSGRRKNITRRASGKRASGKRTVVPKSIRRPTQELQSLRNEVQSFIEGAGVEYDLNDITLKQFGDLLQLLEHRKPRQAKAKLNDAILTVLEGEGEDIATPTAEEEEEGPDEYEYDDFLVRNGNN